MTFDLFTLAKELVSMFHMFHIEIQYDNNQPPYGLWSTIRGISVRIPCTHTHMMNRALAIDMHEYVCACLDTADIFVKSYI